MADGNNQRPLTPAGPAGRQNNISGITPSTWFSPLNPLPDFAPQSVGGRQWDFPVGYNVLVTPRPLEKITFRMLRELVDRCDIMSVIINNRKDQIESRNWCIKFKEGNRAEQKKKAATDDRVKELTEFFLYPDKVNSWDQWVRQWLDDLFVIDAPAVYVRRNRGGGIYGLEVVDGGTIALNIDQNGRRPLPPNPAFKQILKGVPAISYTTDQLIYSPRNMRTWNVFGRSPVEQTMVTINAAINRAQFNTNYYVEGNIPDAIASLPDNFSPKQAAEFTEWWDSLYSGNLQQKRKMKFVPGMQHVEQLKAPELKNVYDDYIARVLCFALGISAQPFVSQFNRATADNASESSEESGKVPLENTVKNFADRVIQSPQFFNYPDLEFAWADKEDNDPKENSEILSTYVKNGIMSYDEARERLGEEPRGGLSAEPGIITASGFITLEQAHAQNERALTEPDPGIGDGLGPKAPLGAGPDNPDKKEPAAKRLKKKSIYH